MQDASAYCAQLVRTADRDRFLAALFAPAEHRDALFALYAFNIEVERVRDVARQPLPGEIRLQWWSEVLAGERSGEAAANPVAAALNDAIARYQLPVEPLSALVEAHAFDLYDDAMATTAELVSYAEKTSSSLFALAVQILGATGDFGNVTRAAGVAHSIARLMASFPQHAARHQLFVPADLLARHAAVAADVFAAAATPALRAALRDMRDIGTAHLASVGRSMTSVPRAAIPALLPLAVSRLELNRMKRLDYEPFAPRPISPWRRQWAIWRAARNVRRIAG
jgi:15-cis-phytoene synthase